MRSGADARDHFHGIQDVLTSAPMTLRILAAGLVGLAAACTQPDPPAPGGGPAELVLRNAHIYTVDPGKPNATSLAVRGGRIAALGSDEDTASLIGPKTRVVDLEGRLVLPAFHDTHTHPVWGGLSHARCPLYEGNSPADYQKIIAKCAAEDPGTGWLYGVGWRDGLFTPEGVPHKKLLDEVVPDRPVAFASVGGHSLWVNSKALEVAGITRKTPDPPNGRIDRDAKGEPIGALQEAAVELVGSLLPPPSAKHREDALRYARDYFNSIGIVGWHDALVPIASDEPGQSIPPGTPETYAALTRSGELKGYVTLALGWDRKRGVEQIPDLVSASERLAQAGVQAKAVKFLLDGVPAQRTAALIEPYADKPDFHGDLWIDADVLQDAVVDLDAKGFQIHIHTIGDRAVRTALDAFAKARERNGARPRRSLISHDNLISPSDLERLDDLGVVTIFQPLWASLDDYMRMVAVRVGPARMTHMYPVASVMRAGGTVAYGSDWPVASANPFEGIEVALTRRHPGASEGERLSPDERVTLEDALRNYTLNAAYALNVDDRSGSLTVGKSADLIVVDRDVFKVRENEIAKTRVLVTLFAGEAVHGDLAGLSAVAAK
jgi:predicted amidohydrolase YtcJ